MLKLDFRFSYVLLDITTKINKASSDLLSVSYLLVARNVSTLYNLEKEKGTRSRSQRGEVSLEG